MNVVERKPLACFRYWPQGGLFGGTGTGLGWKSSGVRLPLAGAQLLGEQPPSPLARTQWLEEGGCRRLAGYQDPLSQLRWPHWGAWAERFASS